MGHVVLDPTSLAYQPKLRERSGHPRRHVNLCNVRAKKKAYPANTQDLQGDEDDGPLVHSDHTVISDDEDDHPLVQPVERKEPVKEKSDPAADRRSLAPAQRRKKPPVWQDPTATLEKEMSGNDLRMS